MDNLSIVAALLGVAGLVLGGFAWWKASEARGIAVDARRIAQEAKHAAEARQAAPTPPAAKAEPIALHQATSPARAETTAAHQAPPAPEKPLPEPPRAASTAHLVVRSGSIPGQDLPTNQGSSSGLIGIFLVNEGPAVAHEMQLHATFPNGTRRSSELHRTLSAHKEMTLYAQVIPADFGAADPLHVLYQIDYQDGNGGQALERDIRVEGGWKGPWKTFIEAKQ